MTVALLGLFLAYLAWKAMQAAKCQHQWCYPGNHDRGPVKLCVICDAEREHPKPQHKQSAPVGEQNS
jgi:hypothetical protein